jgi:DNA-binding HxlR family transcriptional regulator
LARSNDRCGRISGKVLSESLSDLEKRELVERRVLEAKPIRVEYSLTSAGQGLHGVIDELYEWCWKHCSIDP